MAFLCCGCCLGAVSGGEVAGNARKDIEQRTGKAIITSDDAERLMDVVTKLIEDGGVDNTEN